MKDARSYEVVTTRLMKSKLSDEFIKEYLEHVITHNRNSSHLIRDDPQFKLQRKKIQKIVHYQTFRTKW